MLGLVGGAPGGETPRVADSSAAGAGRFFHNSVPPSKLNRLVEPGETFASVLRTLASFERLKSQSKRDKPSPRLPRVSSCLPSRPRVFAKLRGAALLVAAP